MVNFGKVWEDDNRVPLAELQVYGLHIKVLNRLEHLGAIYLHQLSDLTREQFLGGIGNVGYLYLDNLKFAVDNYVSGRQVVGKDQLLWQNGEMPILSALPIQSNGSLKTTRKSSRKTGRDGRS